MTDDLRRHRGKQMSNFDRMVPLITLYYVSGTPAHCGYQPRGLHLCRLPASFMLSSICWHLPVHTELSTRYLHPEPSCSSTPPLPTLRSYERTNFNATPDPHGPSSLSEPNQVSYFTGSSIISNQTKPSTLRRLRLEQTAHVLTVLGGHDHYSR